MTAEMVLIVAHSENRVIGKNGVMPWHLPRDLKYFKSKTMGYPVIMGRRTFASIGRALPNRLNLVLSRDPQLKLDGATVCATLADALAQAGKAEKVFIIGGGQLYHQALPLADRVLRTLVHTTLDGDTFFPELPAEDWQIMSADFFPKDENNAFDLTFYDLKRKK